MAVSLPCLTDGRRLPKPMKPFYSFGSFMSAEDIRQADRLVRHPSSESNKNNGKTHLSKTDLVELARKRLRMLEELNTAVEDELVPLVTKEVDMGQFANIEFDPAHMFVKESPGVSHDGVVVVDFESK